MQRVTFMLNGAELATSTVTEVPHRDDQLDIETFQGLRPFVVVHVRRSFHDGEAHTSRLAQQMGEAFEVVEGPVYVYIKPAKNEP
jgi:hypothetical protein